MGSSLVPRGTELRALDKTPANLSTGLMLQPKAPVNVSPVSGQILWTPRGSCRSYSDGLAT